MKKIISFGITLIACIVLFCVSASALSEDEVKELFKKAEEVAAVFYGDGEYYFNADDMQEYKFFVNDMERTYFNTKLTPEQMQEFLETMFSKSAIEEMYSYYGSNGRTRFIVRDGMVYCDCYSYIPLFVGPYPVKEFSITENTEDRVVYHMKISRNEYYAEYDYILEKQEDGSWIFTQYHYSNHVVLRLEENPQTSDASVIAVGALALSALAAAVVLRKKRG